MRFKPSQVRSISFLLLFFPLVIDGTLTLGKKKNMVIKKWVLSSGGYLPICIINCYLKMMNMNAVSVA